MLLVFTGILTFIVSQEGHKELYSIVFDLRTYILICLLQVDAYPQYAVSALAGNGFARCSLAGT